MILLVFKYEDTNDFGIAIDQNTGMGDLKELSKYQWIRYVSSVNLKEDSNVYQALVFYSLEEEYVEKIKDLFQKEWGKNNNLTISDMVKKFSDVFKKIKSKNNLKKYLGLMGELLFIKKCENLEIDIKDFYSYGEVDNFDFHFPKNKNIEVKYGDKQTRSFIVNWRQLKSLVANESFELGVVLSELDSKNGLDLLDLFHSIKDNKHKNLSVALEKITQLQDVSEELFQEFKVNVDKSEFLFIDKSFLPKIELRENNCLISGKFKLFITEDMGIKFEEKIQNFINK